MRNKYIYKLAISGLLIAVGIVIPMFSPLKIVVEPASFTLGSHIAIFIAVFISPGVAVAVALGTTLGFFLGGFPIVIVFRAASHIVFALVGALWLRNTLITEMSVKKVLLFSVVISLIHAVFELITVGVFYFSGSMGDSWSVNLVLLLVGLGTVVHSIVDFAIAYAIARPLKGYLRGSA